MLTRDQFVIYREFDYKDETENYVQAYDISLIKKDSLEDIAPAGMEAFDATLVLYDEEGYWDTFYDYFYSTNTDEVMEVEMYLSKDRLLFLGYDAYKMQQLHKPYWLTLSNFEDAMRDIGLELGKDNIWQKHEQ